MVVDSNFWALVAFMVFSVTVDRLSTLSLVFPAYIITLHYALEFYKLKAARAKGAAGEALRAANEREKWRVQMVTLTCTIFIRGQEIDNMEDALKRVLKRSKKAEEKLERLVVDAAVAEARLSDLRAKRKWEKAVKLFFSALKNADASARVALCKDPEGEIEKLLETVEAREATGEQALATVN